VPEPPGVQGDAVQGRKGLGCGAGQAAVRQQAGWVWRADEARLPQEGEDHQEDHAAFDVHQLQDRPPEADQALEALRDLRQEAQVQGRDVLSCLLLLPPLAMCHCTYVRATARAEAVALGGRNSRRSACLAAS